VHDSVNQNHDQYAVVGKTDTTCSYTRGPDHHDSHPAAISPLLPDVFVERRSERSSTLPQCTGAGWSLDSVRAQLRKMMALAKVQQWLDNGTSPIYMQREMVTRHSWVQYDPVQGVGLC
jgi:hypothetical protein